MYLLGGHEDGQLPFAAMTRLLLVEDPVIRRCLAWIDDHIETPNPVTSMVERSGLTLRTFARRFQAATGRRPMEHVHAIRIERARDSLERGDETVDAIGYRVGYEDPTFFRRLFKRTTGLTPAAYRRKFVGIMHGDSSIPDLVSPIRSSFVASARTLRGSRRRDRYTECGSHPLDGHAIRRAEHDAGTHDRPLLARPITDQRLGCSEGNDVARLGRQQPDVAQARAARARCAARRACRRGPGRCRSGWAPPCVTPSSSTALAAARGPIV